MKEWKLFAGGDCPNCGNDLEVYSSVPESEDNGKTGVLVYEDEEVRCVKCKFRSAILLNGGSAYIQDGNIDEIDEY
jgi:ribosomal protein S27E